MIVVKSIDDIDKNARSLLRAAHGVADDRLEAVGLISKGRVFYPIEHNGILAFVPSRFIGYRDNSVSKHNIAKALQERDGKKTNPAITRILGKYKPDNQLEGKLKEYCNFLGVEPSKHMHKFWRIEYAKKSTFKPISAVDDIDDSNTGNSDPEYRTRMSGSYVRDTTVRKNVLKRANGRCEFAGCKTFRRNDGEVYLEAHHVIKLSEQGIDRLSNVIALCANHHREAHFGKKWKSLQEQFLKILGKMGA